MQAETGQAKETFAPGAPRCGAKTRSGTPCANAVVSVENGGTGTRCRMHNGGKRRARGVLNGKFKTGAFSDVIKPGELRAAYERSLVDDDTLFGLREEAALIGARLHSLVAGLNPEGSSADLLKRLSAAWMNFKAAAAGGNADAIKAATAAVERIITGGVDLNRAWEGLMTTILQKAKVARSAAVYRMQMGTMISAERAVVIMETLLGAVLRAGVSAEAKRAIVVEFNRLLPAPTSSAIAADGIGGEEDDTDGGDDAKDGGEIVATTEVVENEAQDGP